MFLTLMVCIPISSSQRYQILGCLRQFQILKSKLKKLTKSIIFKQFLKQFIIKLLKKIAFLLLSKLRFTNHLFYHFIHMTKIDKEKLNTWLKLTDDFYLDPDGILGKGCFGEVFRGYSTKRQCLIAIKTMQGQGYEREVQTLKALSSLIHQNIMGFYGFQKIGDSVYIFIEFCPNGTLTDLIKDGISQQNVLILFRQLIEGMCYMNAKGKMHRDLKPDNVLIGLDKDIKISDFGLARETNSIFVTGQMGTPLYAGPQVYLNKYDQSYSERCDVWGAGMVLYEMLTQKQLFQGVKTFQDLKKEWSLYQINQKRVQYSNKLHPNWQFFTNYMLTYDPKKRPTFHEILQKLKKVYDKMHQEIKNKQAYIINQNTKIGKLELLLLFWKEKYGILTKICELFTQQILSIKIQFKYIIQFLCLCNYLCRVKKIIRNLKYKRVKVNQDDDYQMIQEENQQYDLLLDKYKNFFEQKQNYFNDQLQKQILPKLLQIREKKNEPIVHQLKDIFELIADVSDGAFDVQQTYSQALQGLLSKSLQKHHPNLFKTVKTEELKVFYLVFIGALIEKKVQNVNYVKKNYIKDLISSAQSKGTEEILKDLNNLKKQLK